MTFLVPTPAGYRIFGYANTYGGVAIPERLISADLIDTESLEPAPHRSRCGPKRSNALMCPNVEALTQWLRSSRA